MLAVELAGDISKTALELNHSTSKISSLIKKTNKKKLTFIQFFGIFFNPLYENKIFFIKI